ncbi:spore germination protein [Alicyclobacillus sacchari]|uniref:spore germination protein n=1 Tax=Alicyclobacillus sacchari TaxID=392010 RepID=UPI0024E04A02|nr:spore germination protein [Alicyclobacillus sacchari]
MDCERELREDISATEGQEPIPERPEFMQQWLESEWDRCSDLQTREIEICGERILLFWLRGLVDLIRLETGILQPLARVSKRRLQLSDVVSILHTVTVHEISTRRQWNTALADGQVVLWLCGNRTLWRST